MSNSRKIHPVEKCYVFHDNGHWLLFSEVFLFEPPTHSNYIQPFWKKETPKIQQCEGETLLSVECYPCKLWNTWVFQDLQTNNNHSDMAKNNNLGCLYCCKDQEATKHKYKFATFETAFVLDIQRAPQCSLHACLVLCVRQPERNKENLKLRKPRVAQQEPAVINWMMERL